MNQVSTLSENQERVLSILNVLSGFLSILGSLTIVYKVFRHWKKTKTMTPYDRIMLGLSAADIIASLSFLLSPFLIPGASTSMSTSTSTSTSTVTTHRVWAIGTQSTCSFLGWLTQLGLSVLWYNAALSFYYLFTVRFGISRHDFAQRYEKWFHLSACIFSISTASIGLIFDWYSEFQINQGCWLGAIPKGCEMDGTCIGNGLLVGWIFGGIPMLFTFLALTMNNIVIYLYVRKTLQQTRKERRMTIQEDPMTITSIAADLEENSCSHHCEQENENIQTSNNEIKKNREDERQLFHEIQVKEVAT